MKTVLAFFKRKVEPSNNVEEYSKYIERMGAQDYIESTRKYLDYIEDHLRHVAQAFSELSDACDGKEHWVGDDWSWHTFKNEVVAHDISKLSRFEFVQYRDNFFPVKDSDKEASGFTEAWDHHKENNHHHHETASNYMDIVHMVIDWMAMSYKFGGCPYEFYLKQKPKMMISSEFHEYAELLFKHLLEYRCKANKP